MRKKIFVASANDTKDSVAAPIARQLADGGFEPIRWWNAFHPGDWTLDRVLEISRSADGAVFICLGTDQSWYRHRPTAVPRDNLILELGLFLQTVGRHRAVVISDSGTRLPSDLAGFTYISDSLDVSTTAERVTEHLKLEFDRHPDSWTRKRSAITIEVDPVVAEASLRRPVPSRWHQRSLYVGTEGARNWLAVSEDPVSQSPEDQDAIRRLMLDAVNGLSPRSFVSLGPGSGDVDKEIVIRLQNPSLGYFPVDISEG